jgi:hypothetical protein
MLSSSPSKIDELLVTGVSPRPTDRRQPQETAKHEGPAAPDAMNPACHALLTGGPGSPRRNTVSRSFSAAAFLDFLIRRFSLMDRPGFLATDCRGDLLDMALPADLLRRRWWPGLPGLVVVTAAPGRRYLPANAGNRRRAVHHERAQTALQVEQTNANDRREDHQAKKIDHRSCSSSCMRLRGRSTFESA